MPRVLAPRRNERAAPGNGQWLLMILSQQRNHEWRRKHHLRHKSAGAYSSRSSPDSTGSAEGNMPVEFSLP